MRYSIRVDRDGKGVYRSDLVQAAGAAPAMEVPIVVDPAVVKKMFAAVPLVESKRCDSHNKSIAQTGLKTLRYTADSGVFECTYNYSLDERVNDATEAFEAVAETLGYGERLRSKLRFDRLGLDAEMDSLQSAVAEGRALELSNIAPVLQMIENDDRVMDRVRRKADRLLQVANGSARQSSLAPDSSDR